MMNNFEFYRKQVIFDYLYGFNIQNQNRFFDAPSWIF